MKQRKPSRSKIMTSISLALATCVLLFAGCVDEAPIDDTQLETTSQEISKKDIEDIGGFCVYTPVVDEYACMVCTFGFFPMKCSFYYCPTNSTAQCTAAAGSEELNLWFEAEQGVVTSPMQVATGNGASAGSAVLVPTSSTSTGGSVKFTFDVPAGGRTFYPWARVAASSTDRNAFEYRIDSGGYKLWDIPVTGSSWGWSRVFDANSAPGADTGIFLPAGTHTLRFYRRDTGTMLDRVLLTTNPGFVPSVQAFEAEGLARVPPMQVGSTGPSPLATRYLWVPPGAGTGGSFDANISVPSDGLYSIWGRTNAPSVSQDSFFVSANFSERALWNLPDTTATGWTWGQVTDYRNSGNVVMHYLYANASVNFLRFDQRETGAKVDRLIVTNDPGFIPVDYVLSPGNTL